MLKLRITHVDTNGYCGREYHPARSDEGLTVAVLNVDVLFYRDVDGTGDDFTYSQTVDGAGETFVTDRSDAMETRDVPAAAAAIAADIAGQTQAVQDHFETMFRCVTADGRQLDLMEHEVEVVSLNR